MLKKTSFILLFVVFSLFSSAIFGKADAQCAGVTTCSTQYYNDSAYTSLQCDQNGRNCINKYCHHCQGSTGFDNFNCVQTGTCGACISNDQYCIPQYNDPVYIDCAYRVDIGYYPPNQTPVCGNLPEFKRCNSCAGGGGSGSGSSGGSTSSSGGSSSGGPPPCPGYSDTKTYNQSGECYSSTGLGHNTVGGGYTCGPVVCPPGVVGSTNDGNTCIYSQSSPIPGCFAGYGDGGFNPGVGEPVGCRYNPNDNAIPIACPPKNQIVTTIVQDSAGNPIGGIALTVYDNGHGNFTITTAANGKALFSTWSGDHFKVWPQPNALYTFNRSQASPINGTANTSFSCGTTTGWPAPNGIRPPCVIIATANSHIKGTVYNDYNHLGTKDGADDAWLTTVSAVGTSTFTGAVQSDGTYSITVTPGTYSVRVPAPPAGFKAVIASPRNNVAVGSSDVTGIDFSITPLYSISGNIFNDYNSNGKYDQPSENAYIGGGTVTISGISYPVNAAGAYASAQIFTSGPYSVIYAPLPVGYRWTTQNPWTVTLGKIGTSPQCTANSSLDGTCGNPNNGSISKLNFGMNNDTPWIQTSCSDWRQDGGITNPVPKPAAPTTCGGASGPSNAYASVANTICPNNPGVLFSGNTYNVANFTPGTVSSTNQVVGTSSDPEYFTPVNPGIFRSSYDYITKSVTEGQIPITDISTASAAMCPDPTNCTLPGSAPSGVYSAAGDLHVKTSTVTSTNPAAKSYIFLVAGNLYIEGNILVNIGASAVFSVKGNIYVAPTVGNLINGGTINGPSVNAPNIEGIYSTDQSFIVQSAGGCQFNGEPSDGKLNIVGSVVVKAGGVTGSFTNSRNLCKEDPICPSVSIGSTVYGGGSITAEGLTYILNAPTVIKHSNYSWQEVAP